MNKSYLFLKCVWAEAKKQHHNYFHSTIIYVSLFVWPFLSFLTTYYSYHSFDFGNVEISYLTKENLIVYLVLGFMCMSFFRSLVQSAWNFSFERQAGTLEYIYLSPANRFAILLGNAISSVFESVVVMAVFSVLVLLLKREELKATFSACVLVFVLMLIMAILWGVFLNALFLYSRDTDFLFTILEEPMEIFSGVKVPVILFPTWAKVISLIFPLTYVLEAVRNVLLNNMKIIELRSFYISSCIVIGLLFIFTVTTIKIVEHHVRKTGNVNLF